MALIADAATPGRKTDVLDCQWLQQLPTFGLLRGSFRPAAPICEVRSYLRLRDSLTKDCNSLVERIQKALTQMNIQIHREISDIMGVTGQRIVRAIVAGERDCVALAQMKHPQIKQSQETIAKALQGDYRQEHLFELRTALELFDIFELKIMECDQRIEDCFKKFEAKVEVPAPKVDHLRSPQRRLEEMRRHRLEQISGIDLTALPGLDLLAVERILSEVGTDAGRWPSEKHFFSWLDYAPVQSQIPWIRAHPNFSSCGFLEASRRLMRHNAVNPKPAVNTAASEEGSGIGSPFRTTSSNLNPVLEEGAVFTQRNDKVLEIGIVVFASEISLQDAVPVPVGCEAIIRGV